MYRFVGNDPGIPGHLNPDYNPRYRVIGTEFEAMPGMMMPTDLAPTQVGVSIGQPGTGQANRGDVPGRRRPRPQLFAVSKPYVNGTGTLHHRGHRVRRHRAGTVTLDGTAVPTTTGRTTRTIDVSVPAGTPTGAHQLRDHRRQRTAHGNALTFHVLGNGYNPTVREVGPGHQYATIQARPGRGLHEQRRRPRGRVPRHRDHRATRAAPTTRT